MLTLLLAAVAPAASLDNLEVGGPFGTPTATDATAVWWNPSGMALDPGTHLQLEVAPTFATILFDRDDPYGRGGQGSLTLAGAVPFLGVHSDLGIDGFAIGGGLSAPFVRGGRESPEPGVARTHNRAGQVQALFAQGGAAWAPIPQLSIGATGALVVSEWTARVDSETLTQLDEQIHELGQQSGYTDDMIEDPRYATTLQFGHLRDFTASFSAGVMVAPHERVRIGATYVHGARVDNHGSARLAFSCPPQEDTLGRFGAESYGLCYASLDANASVAYTLPWRVHGGVTFEPVDSLEITAMGGLVGWSVYTDFDIRIDGFRERNDLANEEAAPLLVQDRQWARANRDSFWAGVDVKGEVADALTLGGRVLYDKAAVPDAALSPNNYDANALMISGLVAWEMKEGLEVGLSYTLHALQTRTVTESGFRVSLDEDVEDRWRYPQMAGTYAGSIHRLGLVFRGEFGGDDE